MLPTADDCEDCVPAYMTTTTTSLTPRALISTAPFVASFLLVSLIAYRKVYPLLTQQSSVAQQNANKSLPRPATAPEIPTQTLVRGLAAVTFSTTLGLSGVLTELLLCEISNSFNPSGRSLALQITVASLLGLLVIAIPFLGIHSVISRSQYAAGTERKRRTWLAIGLESTGYLVFLLGFWTIGTLLPQKASGETTSSPDSLFQACLDRLGITGVTLMALLSGFASVSAIWQNFIYKPQPISQSDITRKQAGLEATLDMIQEKKQRLHVLEKKLSSQPSKTFWSRAVSSIRSDADTVERQNLNIEISGLETMASSLSQSISLLQSRLSDQTRSETVLGRLVQIFSWTFSIYCIYRIITTSFTIISRLFSPTTSSLASSDPVTSLIAIVAQHIYPSLNRENWTQQLSFLLSGCILLASFSAVMQTSHLFSRFLPRTVSTSESNFALVISQISGMYVISSALMLRNMMPEKVGSVINGALGEGVLEPEWVQGWFNNVFMLAVVSTAVGIVVARQVGGEGLLEDEMRCDNELGKRS